MIEPTLSRVCARARSFLGPDPLEEAIRDFRAGDTSVDELERQIAIAWDGEGSR